MKKSIYLSESEGKRIFILTMVFMATNIMLKVAITACVYLYLTRHTSLEARQLATLLSTAIIIADKFWIQFKLTVQP